MGLSSPPQRTRSRRSLPSGGNAPERGPLFEARVLSPVGTLSLVAGGLGLLRASFDVDEAEFSADLERLYGTAPDYRPDLLAEPMRQFEEYFTRCRTAFALDVDLSEYTPFQRDVMEAVMRVPYGTLSSYGAIARGVGRPRAARAVGTIMAMNPISLVIPCHRIIRSDGSLGRYGVDVQEAIGTAKRMRLLRIEGVEV